MNESPDTPLDLQVLTQLQDALSKTESSSVSVARIEDPVECVESSLLSLVTESDRWVRSRNRVEAVLDDNIEARVAEFKPSELLAAKELYARDRQISEERRITPYLQSVLAAKQKTSGVDGASVVSDEELYKGSSNDVLQGLTALSQLLSVVNKMAKQNGLPDASSSPPADCKD